MRTWDIHDACWIYLLTKARSANNHEDFAKKFPPFCSGIPEVKIHFLLDSSSALKLVRNFLKVKQSQNGTPSLSCGDHPLRLGRGGVLGNVALHHQRLLATHSVPRTL